MSSNKKETRRMRSFHLFAGVGGGALADIANGHDVVGFCEFDEAAKKVLSKWRPDLPIFPDVRTLTGSEIERVCGKVDLLCGGSPCQDLSSNGKRKGMMEGEKSSLIWHQLRLLKELGCGYMFWENVRGAIDAKNKKDFDALLRMLAEAGYGGAWCVLTSAHMGANHVRPRVWLLAKKGHGGFHQINVGAYPKRNYFSTPLAYDGDDAHQPMPAHLRRACVPITVQVFPMIRKGMTMEEIRAHVGALRMNPEWGEQMVGFPVGHTDTTRADVDYTAPHKYPSCHRTRPHPHEAPRLVVVSKEQKAAWSARIKQIGNCQDPVVAAAAFNLLMRKINDRRTLF